MMVMVMLSIILFNGIVVYFLKKKLAMLSKKGM